jgi:hypothetical protein
VAIDDADHRDHDRRQKDAEAPEDEGVDEARAEPLEQLALPEHVGQLVAHPPPRLAAARRGRAEPQQADEERGAAGEQQPADRDRRGERDRGERRGGPAYVSLAFRIAALIAGTTVCRSPITA